MEEEGWVPGWEEGQKNMRALVGREGKNISKEGKRLV